MPKKFNKYFVAITPKGEIQDLATGIKLQLREKFNLKYALKSPSHVTLKMPFLWNAAKEDDLVSRLSLFFIQHPPFILKLKGIGRFGNRVIFVKVEKIKQIMDLQKNLGIFCKTECNLKLELSDYAYNPHMTLAFKDVKERFFEDYILFLKTITFHHNMVVDEVTLLRKEDREWQVCHRFPLSTSL